MKDTKKVLAGIMALSMTAGLTACGGGGDGASGGGNGADTAAKEETTTTTYATVEINTEGLHEGEQDIIENALTQLQDVELENKKIKWMAHYDTFHASGTGNTKSPALELFEQKYGGEIEWKETTWAKRYDDLSTAVLGGEGIDFFPGDDVYNYPKGINSGMFMPVDQYIDMNSAIWQNSKAAMEIFNFGGKHFQFVTNVTAEEVVIYNTETIENNGFDDPWELYKKGEWNWDTFKNMLTEFCDEENEQYGLDGYWCENPLLCSTGVPTVSAVNGQLVCNMNDATVEKAMNFQYDLYTNGLVFDRPKYNGGGNDEHPDMMGDGRQIFWICGTWDVENAFDARRTKIPDENLGFVPVPNPADSDHPYQIANIGGYALCKGAQNPEGVARFAECTIVADNDPGVVSISDRKTRDDFGWSQDLLDRKKEIDAIAAQYPVYDLASGCSTDIAGYTTQGGDNVGMRAALHGYDWPTTRETYADAVVMLVEEVNNELQNKVASL